MDSNSYLNPTNMQAQCSLAIRMLEKDNISQDTVINSLNTFIQDEEIKSSAFDSLKQHVSDYKTIIRAIKSANDSDIADYRTLSGAVGSEVLIGSDILVQKEISRTSKINNENRADTYSDMAATEENVILAAYYRFKEYRYRNLAEIDQRLYEKWQEKEDAYDAIESATNSLFAASEGLRSAIAAGISDIAGAFQVNGYTPNMNAKWRTDIQTQVKQLSMKGTIDQLKAQCPQLSDAQLMDVKQFLEDNPQKSDQSTDEYLESIKNGLLQIPGVTLSAGEILANKLSDIYKAQGRWIVENAERMLSYSDDVVRGAAEYSDDIARASAVASQARKLSTVGKVLPVIGAAVDFGIQVATGEDVKDAAVKTGAHVVAGVIGTAIVGAIIGATPVGWAAVAGAGIGMVLGSGFDYVYDNYGEDIAKNVKKAGKKIGEFADAVGDAVSGFFSGVSDVFA